MTRKEGKRNSYLFYSQIFPSEAKDATSENVPHGYTQVDIPEKE